MKVSEHFDRTEFACHCGCGFATVDVELLQVLENLRKHFASPISINSACRCPAYNSKVGGEPKSKHMYGLAADIVVGSVSPTTVYNYLVECYPGKYGIGKYAAWTHIDVRADKARWEK